MRSAMRPALLIAAGAIGLIGCAAPVTLLESVADGTLGLAEKARVAEPVRSDSAVAHGNSEPKDVGMPASPAAVPDFATFEVRFVKKAWAVQAISGITFEIRTMYTEAVIRANADLADYHVGVKAKPNSLTGYSLNLPSPGSVAGTGAPRLRYAQHTVNDDPLYPNLVDGSQMINPTVDPSVYFLGQGILKTGHANGSPPLLLDAFNQGVSSRPIGSVADIQSSKLAFTAGEALFNAIWATGVTYTASGSTPIAPVVQDRPLTDNASLTNTRYYKWRFPFSATAFTLGSGMPLGRLIFDLRVLDANGVATAYGSTQMMLQQGVNALIVTVSENGQGLGDISFATLPK